MDLYRSLDGMVRVCLTAAVLPEALADMAAMGIELRELDMADELTAVFTVRRRDLTRIRNLARKKGMTLKIMENVGLYWRLKGLARRRVLLLGGMFLVLLWILVSGRIFVLEVDGNRVVPDRRILEAADNCGISFGVSARSLRSEKMKNSLLAELPELSWAGINIHGTRAVITVRERVDAPIVPERITIGHIVACRDAWVTDLTVTAGTLLTEPGSIVKKGQVLISGYKQTGGIGLGTLAEGDVFGITHRKIGVKSLRNSVSRTAIRAENEKWAILIGKKRINLYFGSGICDSSCVKMYNKYVLRLPGGYELPAALVRETQILYDLRDDQISGEYADQEMKTFARTYLSEQMIAGSVLRAREEMIAGDCYLLRGDYDCKEMIGRVQTVEIGVYHGKTD